MFTSVIRDCVQSVVYPITGRIVEVTSTDEEMKYPEQTINLTEGNETEVTTTLTALPYSTELYDSSGNIITEGITKRYELVGGVYHLFVYSVEALNGVKLRILY